VLRRVLSLATLALATLAAPAAGAQQQPPRPATGQPPVDPALAAQVRNQLRNSGLSTAQIRARLQAEGYPSTLLDAYLGTSVDPENSPGSDVFAAVRALGISDTTDTLGLNRPSARREDAVLRRVADSLGTSIDSIDVTQVPGSLVGLITLASRL